MSKRTYTPLFGTVAHNGAYFTLHYRKNELESAISKTGYGPEVFTRENFSGPIIRFDKSPIGNVLECIKGEVAEIEEYYHLSSWSKPITLEQYLTHVRDRGVPVEMGYHI